MGSIEASLHTCSDGQNDHTLWNANFLLKNKAMTHWTVIFTKIPLLIRLILYMGAYFCRDYSLCFHFPFFFLFRLRAQPITECKMWRHNRNTVYEIRFQCHVSFNCVCLLCIKHLYMIESSYIITTGSGQKKNQKSGKVAPSHRLVFVHVFWI